MVNKKQFFSIMMASALLLGSVSAAEKQKAVSKWTYDQLQSVQQLAEKESYKDAEKVAGAVLEKTTDPYEKAVVLRALAALYSMQGKYPEATGKLAEALGLNQLDESQQLMGWLQLGQLYATTQRWKQAVQTLEKWISLGGKATSENLIMLANCHLQLEQYKKALPYVQQAIRQSKTPDESWYRVLLAIRYELKQYSEAVSVLKTLIRMNPERDQYWEQLTGIHQQLDQFREAATVAELAYQKGVFTESTRIMSLIQLLQYIKAPQRAAAVFEKELETGRIAADQENLERLSNVWLQAREYEKASVALKKAADRQKEGGLYYRLAQIQLADEAWQDAIVSLTEALKKGGIDSEGDAWVLLGIANFETGELSESRKAFMKASSYSMTRKKAEQWLLYLDEADNS